MKKLKDFQDIGFYKATDSYFMELIKKNGTIKGLHGPAIQDTWDFIIEVNRVCCKYFKECSLADEHLNGTDFMKFNRAVVRYLAGEDAVNQRIHLGASITTTITGALDFSRKLLLTDILDQALDLCIRGYTSIDGLRHLKRSLKITSTSFPVVMKIKLFTPDIIVMAKGETIRPEILLDHLNSLEKDHAESHDYMLKADPGLENIEFMAENKKTGKFEVRGLDELIAMHNEINQK